MISGGLQIAGNILGSKAQNAGIANAIQTISEGLANTEEFRKQLDTWTQTYREAMDESRKKLQRGEYDPVQESQAYRDAGRTLSRSLAATGNTRSGAAVQGFRELAAAEADAGYQREVGKYGLFGGVVMDSNRGIGGLLGQEDSARARIGGLQVDKGAVNGAMWQGIGDTLATVNDKEAADVKKMMTMLFSKGMAGGNMPGAEGTQPTRSQPIPGGSMRMEPAGQGGWVQPNGQWRSGTPPFQADGGYAPGPNGGNPMNYMNVLGGIFGSGGGSGGGMFGG